jgi:hypothetical protein
VLAAPVGLCAIVVCRHTRRSAGSLIHPCLWMNGGLQGVPCGGHSWSVDGKTWSNQTLGAFGPVVTLANGTVITNAYVFLRG